MGEQRIYTSIKLDNGDNLAIILEESQFTRLLGKPFMLKGFDNDGNLYLFNTEHIVALLVLSEKDFIDWTKRAIQVKNNVEFINNLIESRANNGEQQ